MQAWLAPLHVLVAAVCVRSSALSSGLRVHPIFFFFCYVVLGGVPHTIEREKQQLEDNVGLLN